MKEITGSRKRYTAKDILGNIKIAGFLAYKAVIKGNRWALTLIILVMSFSFVNLIFTSSIIAGVTTAMDTQLVNTLYANAVLTPPEDEYYLKKTNHLEANIRQLSTVEHVSAHLTSNAFFEYKWKEKRSQDDRGPSGTWEVVGIDPKEESLVTTIHDSMLDGRYLEEDDRDTIILGIEIAGGDKAQSPSFSTLGGVAVGDTVLITYPNGVQREYTVKGIFRAREMQRADRQAFVTRKEMASILGRETFSDRATEMLVKSHKGVDENELIGQLTSLGISAEIRGWKEYGGAARSMISTFEIVGSLIGGVGLVVASAVMFILIYVGVINKKRQIGILRAIGIPHNAIVASYFIQALFYVSAGTILGYLLIRFVLQPYFIYNPIEMPIGFVSLTVHPVTMIGSAAGLLSAAILAGLIPPWTIMRKSIIKIIWGT